MKFEYFNPNPDMKTFKSGKVKAWCKDDSAIRAVAKALNLTWDEAFARITKLAAKMHDVPTSKNVIHDFCIINGFEHKTYGKPGKGELRPTVEDFVNEMKDGIYIAYLPHYFVCIVDGVLYNTENVKDSSVYSYWKYLDY